MRRIKWMMGLLVYMFFTLMAMVTPSSAEDVKAIEVGRIYYIEGDLFRYIPDENDWVAVVKDAPFGVEDTLFSGSQGMAEMIVPNGSWIRVGNNTQIQFIALEPDLAEVDVASGVARFYNRGSSTIIKATSPFGYVKADPGTVFDFYVGENSVEVVALKGTVSFVHSASNAKYDVVTGSPSILADQNEVASGDGTVDLAWDRWNETRESVWSAKLKVNGRSAEYLPPSLRYEADCLDENGRWELVPYEGSECWFWRPTTIDVHWSPFTVGIWTEWCGDQTWIPAEPFGYVTHHYGNWIYIRNYWYWAPPVVSVRVGLPLLDVGFFWYPGRVSWIYNIVYVGWVPLAPHETYYSHHNWGGPHHVVVKKDNVMQFNINVRNYANSNHAIIVRQDNLRGVENYRNVRVSNLHPTIINKYHTAPVINDTVINNYTINKQRYNYTNVTVKEKPHNTVVNRIKQNETIISQGSKEDATVLQQEVKSIRDGKVNRETRIEAPKATNYIVPAGEINRPKSEIRFQQGEIKSSREAAPGVRPGLTGNTEQQPIAQHEHVAPTQPTQQEKTVSQPERMISTRPSQQEKPVAQPERVAPARPTQQEKSVVQPERVAPVQPTQQEKSVVQPERVAPTQPTQQEQRVSQPERIIPARPTQQEKSVVQPERVAPVQPTQQEQGVSQHERVVPARPTQQEQVVSQLKRVAPARPAESGGVDRSNKVEKSESATKEGKPQEKVGQGKSEENTDSSESVEVGKPGE